MKVNYEDELNLELQNILKNKFNTDNIIFYIFLRYMIINKINNISNIDLIKFTSFLLKECNLPNDIYFNKVFINFFSAEDTSFINIINNWILDLQKDIDGFSRKDYLNSLYKELYNIALKNSSRYKKTSYYKEILMLKTIQLLNEKFKVKINNTFISDKFSYPKNFKISKTIEQTLSEKIEILSKYNETIIFTEKEIENYLKNNLNKLEEGLTFISCQFAIKDAFIDILAKDKNNCTVIIELKIDNDERLVWQSIYYPKQYKIEHSNENVRMICLVPNYSDWILSALKEVKNVELYEYKLVFNDDIILNINISKKE